jgi:hypothetical protein
MNKRNTLLSGMAIAMAASSALAAGYTRMDFLDRAGSFVSVLLSDLKELTYGDGTTENGFSSIIINQTDGTTRTLSIDQYPSMKITPEETDKAFAITINNAENYRVNLLDCYNNSSLSDGLGTIDPEQPIGWRGNFPECEGNFLLENTPGYTGTYHIIGQYTGKDYAQERGFVWETPDSLSSYWCACYTFYMPNEPITFSTEEEELTTYAGANFLGEYHGSGLTTGAKTFSIKPEETATFTLQANGAYRFTTTDSLAYDELNLYTYNDSLDRATYVYTEREDWDHSTHYGIISHRFDDVTLLEVKNITTGRIEDTRLYAVSTDPTFSFTYATDDYGIDHVIEATTAKGTRYFYLTGRGSNMYEAEATFYYGSVIGCKDKSVEAVISVDGAPKCKVSNFYGSMTYTNAGAEAGTYTGGDGDLKLDGFSRAWLNGVECSYIIEGGLVTLTESGVARWFVIDTEHSTYSEVVSDAWTGAEVYSLDSAAGINENGVENTNNSISITFNRNLLGNEAEGYASVVIRADGLGSAAVSDMGRYIYNAEEHTVTITRILVGTANSWTQTRSNLILHVADDMKSLYIDNTESDRIYATTSLSACVFTGSVNTLLAPQDATPTLAENYVGTCPLDNFGTSAAADVTLSINAEASTASLAVVFMNYDMIRATDAAYTFDGTTLTISGVSVGDGNYGTKSVDIVFTLNDDGTLTGSGSEVYYGANMITAYMAVDLSHCTLAVPTEE